MSTYKVEIVKIESVDNHPDADRLELIRFEGSGYRVVSGKGNLHIGDLAYYFPVETVLPNEWVEKFGIQAFYSKKIRAAKLRGIFSEGLLIPVAHFPIVDNPTQGMDVTELFGATKYEYPIPTNMGGEPERPIYDRERFPSPEHLKKFIDELKEGEEIVVTEKIHGTNFCVLNDGTFHAGSHNYFWKIDSEANAANVYVRAFKENPKLAEIPVGTQVFGEIYGVQDLKYGLSNGKIGLRLFAVRENGKFLDYDDFVSFCTTFGFDTVPVLYRGAYSYAKIESFNNANSTLANHMMEGVVILPVKERSSLGLSRVCLKYISEKYALRKDGTELH